MTPENELGRLALQFALQNAVEHGAEANTGAVIGRIMALKPEYKENAAEVAAAAKAAAEEVNALSPEDREARLEEIGAPALEAKAKRREGLPDLQGVEDVRKVVMRFAPNPNGPPSLGHSRGMCVNGWYARKYRGDLILRFDDTDPVNKAPWEPAYQMFRDAFDWLGIRVTREVRASDRMETYYDYAEKSLVLGAAYTCTCSQEEFKAKKDAGEACPHRDEEMPIQLERWAKMRDGAFAPGACVVRIRTEIDHPDPALRDWVAFRVVDIVNHPHARIGKLHRVWPMLDFESAIEDHLLGVTHIIRGKDLADSEKKQRFLYEQFGWRYPEVLHWGRVAVHEFGKFSTSGMRADIEAGKFTGWDDPRLPTLKALRRRGFLPEAIRNFWVSLGLTEKDISASMENLEAENRKLLDGRVDRCFFVPGAGRLEVTGLEEPFTAKLPRHPDDPKRGHREQVITDKVLVPAGDVSGLPHGTIFRLKDGLNLQLEGEGRASFVSVDPKAEREGPIVQWIAPRGVPCTVLMPTGQELTGVVERDVLRNRPGTSIQFERFGFVRLERVSENGVEAVFTHP